ncbi:Saposin B-type domain-containing protein [Mycena venus]|uniref:Saposin B-type domain-containing protein n=1 Tax=Mycena venus TaxID=2733690 RepID=A0A8H6YDE4_9AGAR|nr:Saposin B-type domain-containing protein [Mycena venus]
MATPPPKLPPLDGTLGDIQIALVVATWLFGIGSLQAWNYYREFPKDPKILKGLVGGIWLLELGYTIVCWHAMYIITVTFYGKPQHILEPPLSLVFPIFFNALIAIAVQTFFVYRVKVLSGKWLIPILCCAMNLARLGFNMLLFAKLSQRPQFTLLTTVFNWEIILVSSIGPAVDIIVAASLVYYLWHRRNTDFKQTNRMVDTIIIWTVETTLLTTISGVMQLVLFLARRHDLSWLVFFLIQGKLFSNSLMASLNGRSRFRTPTAGTNAMAWSTGGSTANNVNTDVVIRMHQISETAFEDGTRRSHGKEEF